MPRPVMFSVKEVVTALLLMLLIATGAEVTYWQNRAAALEGKRPATVQKVIQADRASGLGKTPQPTDWLPWLTFAIGALTVGVMAIQAYVMRGQNTIITAQKNIAAQQADIANRQMLISHRPKVIVRRIELLTDIAETPLAIRYLFVNVGQTEARNLQFMVDYVIVRPGTHITGRATYQRTKQKRLPPFNLASGATLEEDFVDDKPFGDSSGDIKSGSRELIFYGQIAYNDGLGNTRRTGFVRRYDHKTYRFGPTGDADNEYED